MKNKFTETQRLLSDEKSSEIFIHSRIRPAHRSISISKYCVSPVRALSYHKYQIGLRRKNDEDFPFQSNRGG